MFKIGNVKLKNNVVLAPMAGVCNSAFRRIVKEYGVGLVEAEMVSDKALMYDSEKTKKMLYMTDFERPISQQIFGSDKESFVIAAKKVYDLMWVVLFLRWQLDHKQEQVYLNIRKK